MKVTLIVFLAFIFSCNQADVSKSKCFHYPSKIEDLNARNLYDTARWILFNWLSDKKEDNYYYGQMELRFKDVFIRNDSLEIFFLVYPPDSLTSTDKKSHPVARASVAFRKDTKERLWAFVYPFNDFSDGLEHGDKELDFPPSDKAIQFIKKHRDSLNNCYHELAVKLKVLNE
jgi:hypothetical protein